MTIRTAASTLVLVAALAACGSGSSDRSTTGDKDGSTDSTGEMTEPSTAEPSGGSSASTAQNPPPEPTEASFMLEPLNPEPGATFEASFDPSNSRGGYFTLSRWDGEEWAAPAFLLESDVNRPPSATRIPGEFGVDDYGAGGPGPDGLVMPDEIEDGRWRLCTANAFDHVCTQITVGE